MAGYMVAGGSAFSADVISSFGNSAVNDGETISRSYTATENCFGFFSMSWQSAEVEYSYSLKKNGIVIQPNQVEKSSTGCASWAMQLKKGDVINAKVHFSNFGNPGNKSSGSLQYLIVK